jgi:hypothetical protein
MATVRNFQTQKAQTSQAAFHEKTEKESDFVLGEVLVTFKEELPVDDQVLSLESDTVSDPRLKKLKQKI